MAPKSTDEIVRLLVEIDKTTEYTFDFYDRVSDLMADICNEALDPMKIIGKVSYDGSPLLDEWAYKDGCYPFHIMDKITDKMVSDPRVIVIGKICDHFGIQQDRNGMMAMNEVYIRTAQRIHTSARPLDYAWSGIGSWRA